MIVTERIEIVHFEVLFVQSICECISVTQEIANEAIKKCNSNDPKLEQPHKQPFGFLISIPYNVNRISLDLHFPLLPHLTTTQNKKCERREGFNSIEKV